MKRRILRLKPLAKSLAGVWSRVARRVRRLTRRRRFLVAAAAALLLVGIVASCTLCARTYHIRRLEDCRPLARQYGRATGLDPDLVMAVIRAESSGDPRAVSRSGARGLMQLMPRTAAEVAQKARLRYRGPDDLFDPRLNVRLGTLYLSQLRRLFGDEPWLYVAAYNAGPGCVDRLRLQHPELSPREAIERYAPDETRRYVPRVLRYWRRGGA